MYFDRHWINDSDNILGGSKQGKRWRIDANMRMKYSWYLDTSCVSPDKQIFALTARVYKRA